MGPHSYYFEPCAGSMAVLLAKKPSSNETVCDLHGALTNMAMVIQDEGCARPLFDDLSRTMYSDDVYVRSKNWLKEFEDNIELIDGKLSIAWAYHYFIASWMGRNGTAGTHRVNYQIATRWTAKGGSGPLRFKNAVASIPAWCERLRNVHILRRDLFKVLPKIEDAKGLSIYADPPYLLDTRSNKDKTRQGGTGRYMHEFAEADHQRLSDELQRFEKARVVVSYYASPRLEALYPGWTLIDHSRHKNLHVQNKRGMGRLEAPEVLLVNGPSFASPSSPTSTDLFQE